MFEPAPVTGELLAGGIQWRLPFCNAYNFFHKMSLDTLPQKNVCMPEHIADEIQALFVNGKNLHVVLYTQAYRLELKLKVFKRVPKLLFRIGEHNNVVRIPEVMLEPQHFFRLVVNRRQIYIAQPACYMVAYDKTVAAVYNVKDKGKQTLVLYNPFQRSFQYVVVYVVVAFANVYLKAILRVVRIFDEMSKDFLLACVYPPPLYAAVCVGYHVSHKDWLKDVKQRILDYQVFVRRHTYDSLFGVVYLLPFSF